MRDRRTFVALRRAPRARRGSLTVAWLDDHGVPPRLAFSVSRKVAGSVGRNRVRRRLRAAARTVGLPPGTWLVIPSPAAATESYENLSSALTDAVTALAGGAR